MLRVHQFCVIDTSTYVGQVGYITAINGDLVTVQMPMLISPIDFNVSVVCPVEELLDFGTIIKLEGDALGRVEAYDYGVNSYIVFEGDKTHFIPKDEILRFDPRQEMIGEILFNDYLWQWVEVRGVSRTEVEKVSILVDGTAHFSNISNLHKEMPEAWVKIEDVTDNWVLKAENVLENLRILYKYVEDYSFNHLLHDYSSSEAGHLTDRVIRRQICHPILEATRDKFLSRFILDDNRSVGEVYYNFKETYKEAMGLIDRYKKIKNDLDKIYDFEYSEKVELIKVNVDGYEFELTSEGYYNLLLKLKEEKLKELQRVVISLAHYRIEPSLYPYWVNIYLHDKAYGGPEEGGWWYNFYQPIAFKNVSTKEAAHEMAEELREGEYSNEGRRSISSMASEGEYVVRVESHPPVYSPRTRPHYE